MPVFEYPPRLALARAPTPLVPLRRLSLPPGSPRVWVKRDDLTGCVGSGNKVRKLEFILAAALAQDCDTIITCGGLQSNHCRATALFCAELGLHCHLVLRGEPTSLPDGNLFLDQLLGASIDTYSVRDYTGRQTQLMADLAQRYIREGRKPYVIPTGASDGVGIWGYVRAAEELADDCQRAGIVPAAVICATGSGGTQAGLTLGTSRFLPEARVIGVAVCDDKQYFLDKVAEDIQHWSALYADPINPAQFNIEVWDQYRGPSYGVADPHVVSTIQLLARSEGILLDPVYTGKAFHALLTEINAGFFNGAKDVVFLHTGGVFGLMAQREQMMLGT